MIYVLCDLRDFWSHRRRSIFVDWVTRERDERGGGNRGGGGGGEGGGTGRGGGGIRGGGR